MKKFRFRIGQINNDMDREQFLLEDAKENLLKVRDEKSLLEKQQGELFIEEEDINANVVISKDNNPIIDYLSFEDGYEKALASVFSDELMASINQEQSSFWRTLDKKNYQSTFPKGSYTIFISC